MAEKVAIIKLSALLALLQLSFVGIVKGRALDRCSLVVEMDQLGVPREFLGRWARIVQCVSDYHTEVISPYGEVLYYGLFQMSDKYWCQTRGGQESKNLCNIYCDELLTDDIEVSVRCAQRIQRLEGWAPWSQVKGQMKIDDCFEDRAGEVLSNGTATIVETVDITDSDSLSPEHISGLGDALAYKPQFL